MKPNANNESDVELRVELTLTDAVKCGRPEDRAARILLFLEEGVNNRRSDFLCSDGVNNPEAMHG